MVNKLFSELNTGDRFKLNGSEYIKTDEVRVSCCRSINCQEVSNTNNKTYVAPNTQVTIDG